MPSKTLDLQKIKQWQSLPQDVQYYVYSEKITARFQELCQKYGLTDEQKKMTLAFIENIFLGTEGLDKFFSEVNSWELTGADFERFLVDILNLYFTPLEPEYDLGVTNFLYVNKKPVEPAFKFKDIVTEYLDKVGLIDINLNIDNQEESETVIQKNELSEAMVKFLQLPEVQKIGEQLSAFEKGQAYDEIKNKFYEAINSKDRLGFVSSLAQLFSSGQIKELFTNDERYVKFWRNRILKSKGLDGVRKFDENPLRREQFGSFIRHVLQERFEIPAEDAVLWGVFLSSLAHRAGDTNYDRLAYGDLTSQQFKWNL